MADEPKEAAKTKEPWAKPTLTFLGTIRDIVQGSGKQGSVVDADPSGSRKQGTG